MRTVPSHHLVRPISFEARYGAAHRRTLVLGGGGTFFVAWQVAYLHELSKRGVDFTDATVVVGTSAGSIISAIYASGGIRRFAVQMGTVAKVPALLSAMSSMGGLKGSQSRALDLFRVAPDSNPATVRRIGHAALAADTKPRRTLQRSTGLMIASRRWPSRSVHITTVDAFTAERLVITHKNAVPISAAAAASCSVPGIFAPQIIQDRFCMDGGLAGSGTHCDLVAGADKAFVVSLSEYFASNSIDRGAGMTQHAGAYAKEIQALRSSGTEVVTRGPEHVDMTQLMEPSSVPDALAMGRRQAAADAEELAAFWGSPR